MKPPKITKFHLAEGRLFSYWCPDCQQENGGGIDGPLFQKWRRTDKHSPLNIPCIWCDKGPMVMIYLDVLDYEPKKRKKTKYQP